VLIACNARLTCGNTKEVMEMTYMEEIRSKSFDNGHYAIAYALLNVAEQIKKLGFNDASTPIGAIEGLALMTKEGLVSVSQAIDRIYNN
jgi:hypothetical protein